jgi:hypothetical protein
MSCGEGYGYSYGCGYRLRLQLESRSDHSWEELVDVPRGEGRGGSAFITFEELVQYMPQTEGGDMVHKQACGRGRAVVGLEIVAF